MSYTLYTRNLLKALTKTGNLKDVYLAYEVHESLRGVLFGLLGKTYLEHLAKIEDPEREKDTWVLRVVSATIIGKSL